MISSAKSGRRNSGAGYTIPLLVRRQQQIAKGYHAALRRSHFFLYDSSHKLVYRGQFDDSRPDNGKPITGEQDCVRPWTQCFQANR